MSSDVRHLIRALREQGWMVTRNGLGHFKCVSPKSGTRTVIFSISTEPRAMKNTMAQLRRNGFDASS